MPITHNTRWAGALPSTLTRQLTGQHTEGPNEPHELLLTSCCVSGALLYGPSYHDDTCPFRIEHKHTPNCRGPKHRARVAAGRHSIHANHGQVALPHFDSGAESTVSQRDVACTQDNIRLRTDEALVASSEALSSLEQGPRGL